MEECLIFFSEKLQKNCVGISEGFSEEFFKQIAGVTPTGIYGTISEAVHVFFLYNVIRNF